MNGKRGTYVWITKHSVIDAGQRASVDLEVPGGYDQAKPYTITLKPIGPKEADDGVFVAGIDVSVPVQANPIQLLSGDAVHYSTLFGPDGGRPFVVPVDFRIRTGKKITFRLENHNTVDSIGVSVAVLLLQDPIEDVSP